MKQLLCLFLIFTFVNGYTCTNFLVTPGASTDGSAMITYAADAHFLYGELYFYPRQQYGKNDSLEIFEFDTGKRLGKIKQVKETYKVVGYINEFQLAMAETTFGGRPELVDTTGVIDYGSLMYITLQRAKTAREAIRVMDELVQEYGYYSSGESFSIADKNEVWVMEMIGKGSGGNGAVWVAQKIPDGYISGHANQARITAFPLNDKENCLYSKDVISFAREQGFYEGSDEDFSFVDAYAPLDFYGARFCESRVWSGFRKVAEDMDQYQDYAMGYNLENRMPLWIKPTKKLHVKDVFNLMRDYFGDTPLDMTGDVGAGPYGNIVRWRPLTWEVDSVTYINERAISTQQTGFSFISQSNKALPDAIGGKLWFGVDDTYSTVYTPLYCGITEPPMPYRVGNGDIMTFSDSSAFWAFNQVSNFAYTRYNEMIPIIKERQSALEEKFFEQVKTVDAKANKLYKKDKATAEKFLTEYSSGIVLETLEEWQQLYKELFVKFMDGNIKEKVEGQRNPKIEQPGYSEEWYRILIEQTGDKYKVVGEGH